VDLFRSNKAFLGTTLFILLVVGIVAYTIGIRSRTNDKNQPSSPIQGLATPHNQLRLETTGTSTGVIYDSMNNVVLELDDGQ